MNCANHAEAQAVAFCIRCGRALCDECTRTVRGSVYCEPCLADIVQGKTTSNTAHSTPVSAKQETVVGSNPGAAFALGLIPGVGAIYNGEFVKAAIHVLIFGVLISLADDTRSGEGLLSLAIAAFYIYMPFEAYYTAKKRKLASEGVELETPIDRLQQQFGGIRNKEFWGGMVLVIIGTLFLLDNFGILRLEWVARIWPVILILIGLWMLKRFQEKAT
jgi:TM2 domain-containing membrane protein YozV